MSLRRIPVRYCALLLFAGCGAWSFQVGAAPVPQAAGVGEAASAGVAGAAPDLSVPAFQATAWGRVAASDPALGEAFDVFVDDAAGSRQLFAHIGRDGVFRLVESSGEALPAKAPRTVSEALGGNDGCRNDAMALVNQDARVDVLALYAVRPGEDRRYRLLATTSPAYAEWSAGMRAAFEPGDATLDVYVAGEAASVRGLCHLHSDDVVDTDVQLTPGLNLVRTRYDRFLMVGREPGSAAARKEAGITVRSETAFPDDVHWYLLEDVSSSRVRLRGPDD